MNQAVGIANSFSFAWGLFAWGLLALFARPIAMIFNSNEEVIVTVQLFLWIVPAGFGLQGILSIINSNLNTVNKPLQASTIIVVQMLIIGLPLIYLGKAMANVRGIFVGLAVTYCLGGVISLLLNRQLMRRFNRRIPN